MVHMQVMIIADVVEGEDERPQDNIFRAECHFIAILINARCTDDFKTFLPTLKGHAGLRLMCGNVFLGLFLDVLFDYTLDLKHLIKLLVLFDLLLHQLPLLLSILALVCRHVLIGGSSETADLRDAVEGLLHLAVEFEAGPEICEFQLHD
jgi:hypothetical protein